MALRSNRGTALTSTSIFDVEDGDDDECVGVDGAVVLSGSVVVGVFDTTGNVVVGVEELVTVVAVEDGVTPALEGVIASLDTGGGGVLADELAPDDGGEPAENEDGDEESEDTEDDVGTGRGEVAGACGFGRLPTGCAGSNNNGDAVTVL